MREVHGLAPLYTLDALDDLERRRFERHLEDGCEQCLAELAEADRGLAHLARAHAESPPPEMRSAVMSAVDSAAATVSRRRVVPRRRVAWAAAVAAVVALALVFALPDTAGDPEILAILGADDVVEIEVAGTPAGASVVLSYSPSLEGAVFEAEDLDTPSRGNVYQLWLIDEEGPTSAGTFSPMDGSALVRLDGRATDASIVGLTVEPEGGSPAPTGAILLAEPLSG